MNDIVDFFFGGSFCANIDYFSTPLLWNNQVLHIVPKRSKESTRLMWDLAKYLQDVDSYVLYAGWGGVLSLLLIPGGDKYLERRNDIFQGPSFFFPNIGKCSFWRSRAISYEFMQYANTETRMYIHGFISIIILPYII